MELDVFDRNPYGTNCWMIASDGADEVVVVDPGFEPEAVHAMVAATGKRPSAVLLTHAHADHAMQAGAFAGDALPVMVHPADAVAFEDPDRWAMGSGTPLSPVKDLRTFENGDVLRLGGGVTVEVLHTPGHTPGSCCFRVAGDALVFSGDLVFAGTVGRSDFANSDPEAMHRSLERFLTLPDELEVLPGHGPRTSVGRERSSNPFLVGIG